MVHLIHDYRENLPTKFDILKTEEDIVANRNAEYYDQLEEKPYIARWVVCFGADHCVICNLNLVSEIEKGDLPSTAK